MPFSEDDLRKALKRQDPGPEFTRRVMERLHERDAKQKPLSQQKKSAIFFWLPQMRFAPALGFALALVLAVGTWIGYQSYQQHQQALKVEQYQQKLAGERAKQETILALRISSEKLNHVLRKVDSALPPDVKIRRERL
jgi:type VI protein secretion system component VasF